ncbi:MAG: class I SAM-dependent methyltransferase [Planctomycetes bacterium]|nr:class I SAM-dependent methyltransferase [Planctomycetota bacterium]
MGFNEHIYREFARLYDGEMARIGFHEKWKALFDRLRIPGKRALDLACGTGTVALELAGRGWEVEGVDASAEMLEVARGRAGSAGIRWTRGDLRTFEAGKPVDLVTCAFDSVNYLLRPEDLAACFRQVAAHLAPGGRFLFDAITPWGQRAVWGDGAARIRHGEGWFGVWEPRRLHRLSQLALTYFERDGAGAWRRWEETHTERGWSKSDLGRAARAARMEIESLWDGSTCQAPGPRAIRLHAVCRPVASGRIGI